MSEIQEDQKNDGTDVHRKLDEIAALASDSQRADRLAELGEVIVDSSHRTRALAIAGQIAEGAGRAKALATLIPRLKIDDLPEALRLAQALDNKQDRERILGVVGRRLRTTEGWARRVARATVGAASGPWPAVLASVFVVLLVAVGLAWICWVLWMPSLWHWSFDSFSWRTLVGGIGVFYLAITPAFSAALFNGLLEFWQEFGSLNEQVRSARKAQQEIEKRLLEDDEQNLVMIVGYSRQMLSEYYGIAMSQAQRSFRYCLIAMWLGFFVLLAGVLDSLFGLSQLLNTATSETPLAQSDGVDPNTVVLLTGVVLEFIAAAFLWVYRFSIQQQTYYYQRQLKLHNVLLAHRISSAMGDGKDESVKLVIEKLLEEASPQGIEPPTSAGVGKLLKPK